MTFVFEHLVGGWIFGKILEITKKLTKVEWALLLWGAIFPDIDYILEWTSSIDAHRIFTHSITFAIIAAIAVFIIASLLKKKFEFINPKSYAALIFAGICIHLILDMIYYTGIPLLWPYQMWFAYSGILTVYTPLPDNYETYKFLYNGAVIDMAVGVAWLGWLTLRRRIKY